jgi:hypothetical protein
MAQLINKAQMRPVLWHHLKERKTIFFINKRKGKKRKEMQAKEEWRILWKHVCFFALLRCLGMIP